MFDVTVKFPRMKVGVQIRDAQVAAMYLSFGSDILEDNQVTDYLIRIVQPRLSAIEGVQKADILGGRVRKQMTVGWRPCKWGHGEAQSVHPASNGSRSPETPRSWGGTTTGPSRRNRSMAVNFAATCAVIRRQRKRRSNACNSGELHATRAVILQRGTRLAYRFDRRMSQKQAT